MTTGWCCFSSLPVLMLRGIRLAAAGAVAIYMHNRDRKALGASHATHFTEFRSFYEPIHFPMRTTASPYT
jgi:hypothetical protein